MKPANTLFGLLLTFGAASAQPLSGNADDSARMVDLYTSTMRDQQPVFNGRLHARYPFIIHGGSPYFRSDSLTTGSITCNNITVHNIPLLYDLVSDDIITYDYHQRSLVKLVKPHVQAFSLQGSGFRHLAGAGRPVSDGFYEILHDGATPLYKKEVKRITDEMKIGQGLEKAVRSQTYYYVLVNGKYISVGSAKTLASALGNKQEIKEHIKRNRQKYKTSVTDDILRDIVSFYDGLTH